MLPRTWSSESKKKRLSISRWWSVDQENLPRETTTLRHQDENARRDERKRWWGQVSCCFHYFVVSKLLLFVHHLYCLFFEDTECLHLTTVRSSRVFFLTQYLFSSVDYYVCSKEKINSFFRLMIYLRVITTIVLPSSRSFTTIVNTITMKRIPESELFLSPSFRCKSMTVTSFRRRLLLHLLSKKEFMVFLPLDSLSLLFMMPELTKMFFFRIRHSLFVQAVLRNMKKTGTCKTWWVKRNVCFFRRFFPFMSILVVAEKAKNNSWSICVFASQEIQGEETRLRRSSGRRVF